MTKLRRCGCVRWPLLLLLSALALGLAGLSLESARGQEDLIRFTQISTGDQHVCGLTSEGAVECWGDDEYGRASPPAGRFTQVSAGDWHSCGLTSEGCNRVLGHRLARHYKPA